MAVPSDVLGQQLLTHGDTHGQSRLVGLGDLVCRHGREDRRVRADHAVRAAGPDDRHLRHFFGAAITLGGENLSERSVRDDARVVVDAAVTLGFADDCNDAVGLEDTVVDQLGELTGVGDAV